MTKKTIKQDSVTIISNHKMAEGVTAKSVAGTGKKPAFLKRVILKSVSRIAYMLSSILALSSLSVYNAAESLSKMVQ